MFIGVHSCDPAGTPALTRSHAQCPPGCSARQRPAQKVARPYGDGSSALVPMAQRVGKPSVCEACSCCRGFSRWAEHLSVSRRAAGADSSKCLARVSTRHARKAKQSAFYACQDVIVLVLIHSPIGFLSDQQLSYLIKPTPSTKRQQVQLQAACEQPSVWKSFVLL